MATARDSYEGLILAFQSKPRLGEFEARSLQATRERQARLVASSASLLRFPLLTVQILHGDLSGPNVLLKDDDAALFMDFRPPTPSPGKSRVWAVTPARAGQRRGGLAHRIHRSHFAYRDANPKASANDLVSSLRVGCAAKLCSTSPFSAPVKRPHVVDAALESYGRARHAADLMLLEQLPLLEEALRATLR
ncbi:hypothetical protein [Streptomyces sp. 1222.5]|uniref:hypothetical protein n=1 Tax=Streptomyces sp. 1222.5 TaxID=1881026 RepID=UPI003EBDF54E